MSDSTDSDGSVIFVAEQHTVRVQVHQPETQKLTIPETQDDTPTSSINTIAEVDDTPTSSINTIPEFVVIPPSEGDNLRQNTGKKYYF